MITTYLLCAATVLVNLTSDPWNSHDKKIYERAKYVCANDYRYKDEFPCIKSLTKYPDQHYSVICGGST